MYELIVEGEFCAAHAIVIKGAREAMHGHNFRVKAGVVGEALDGEGLLVDFHAVEGALRGVLDGWNNRNLNECPPFDRLNPTAELIARTLYELMTERLAACGVQSGGAETPDTRARLGWVSVTEAPGCTARYEPGR
ncbi:MAG: 6-carboxytetrahydropterin synthase [Phycisphaeraceae bacterium]|nr:6-carboxytetrahydropterin synthase [Phycisphaeraceae bacterium]